MSLCTYGPVTISPKQNSVVDDNVLTCVLTIFTASKRKKSQTAKHKLK